MKSTALLRLIAGGYLAVLCSAPLSARETQRQYLSGLGKDDAVPWKFFCTAGAQSGYWTNIPVPSNWEMHGFGTLSYQRDPTNAVVEEGRYEHDFRIPGAWIERRVFLVFDGVMTDTHVTLNGQPLSPAHQGSFYRFKYEVTGLLKFNALNRLEVLVRKRSENNSVNAAERQGDYWIFGGIFRPVYLEVVPAEFIERVAIDARADGAFALDVFLNGAKDGDSIEAQILEPDGRRSGGTLRVQSPGGERAKVELRASVPSPRQWTAETPHLYSVEVRLRRGVQTVHQITQRFGFRTIEVREGEGIFVNERRVILKGANRHSFWPNAGRTLSEAVHRMDLELMKEANLNAVRMSHYPPDELFLDLCDELGLYVLNELAGWHASYDTTIGRKLIEAMVTRDVNHPSILFWDNGNEGGWNTELDDEFAKWDPQKRRVLHPWSTFNGVNTAHYLTYERMKPALAGAPNFRNNDGRDAEVRTNTAKFIHLPTEFLHGMFDGGAGAGLRDYWQAMTQSKFFGGGFIWAWLDEGVKHPKTGEVDVFGNRAPDGILGPYREREASFYTIKEIWSPIVIRAAQTERSQMVRPVNDTVDLQIENHYAFLDTRQCEFFWYLFKFSGPDNSSNQLTAMAARNAFPPTISPGETDTVRLHLPTNWHEADVLGVHVTDPTGRILCRWVWPLPGMERFQKAPEAARDQKTTAAETRDAVEIKAGDLTLRVSKRTGMLLGAQRGRQMFSLTNGPRPAVGDATLTGVRTRTDGGDSIVELQFSGSLKTVAWRVRGNGWVTCDYTYTANGPQDFHGVLFDYPESLVRRKRWLGEGPYRVWKNRMEGGTLFLWANDYNNTITGWRDWIYPEFKGCFANVQWMQLQTAEGAVTFLPHQTPFVQVLTPELPPTNLLARTAVTLPQTGLGFLNAIPAIGNKFHLARDTGPQGQPHQAAGDYTGSVSFYFDFSSAELPAARRSGRR